MAIPGREPADCDEAEATPPFEVLATFVRPPGVGVGKGVGNGVGVGIGVGKGVGRGVGTGVGVAVGSGVGVGVGVGSVPIEVKQLLFAAT